MLRVTRLQRPQRSGSAGLWLCGATLTVALPLMAASAVAGPVKSTPDGTQFTIGEPVVLTVTWPGADSYDISRLRFGIAPAGSSPYPGIAAGFNGIVQSGSSFSWSPVDYSVGTPGDYAWQAWGNAIVSPLRSFTASLAGTFTMVAASPVAATPAEGASVPLADHVSFLVTGVPSGYSSSVFLNVSKSPATDAYGHVGSDVYFGVMQKLGVTYTLQSPLGTSLSKTPGTYYWTAYTTDALITSIHTPVTRFVVDPSPTAPSVPKPTAPSPAARASAPRVTVVKAPKIVGALVVGRVARCAPAAFAGDPPASGVYRTVVRWLRGSKAVGRGAQYRVTQADVGKKLTCVVTATGLSASASATSAPRRVR